jgi:outer membrane lipoprotein carrier protein
MNRRRSITCRFKFFSLPKAAAAVLVVFVALLLAAYPSIADAPQSAQDAAILERIQGHYQNTSSFSAKFTEELSGIGGTKQTRSGKVWYKRPGKMRWQFDTPRKETVVSDGHKLYDYQPDLNQVLEVPIEHAFKSAAPLAFLLGMGNLRRDFNATLPTPTASAAAPMASDTMVRVVLTPKGGGDRVEMGLDPSTYDLMAAKVTDAVGNTTSIHFSDVHTNVQLADSMFHFEVPPGADVVLPPGTSPPQRL